MVNLGTKIYGVKDEGITVARDFIKLKYKLIGKCFSEPVDLTSNYVICCDATVSINFWYFSLDSVDKKPNDSRYIDAELVDIYLKEGVHINNILNRNSDFKHDSLSYYVISCNEIHEVSLFIRAYFSYAGDVLKRMLDDNFLDSDFLVSLLNSTIDDTLFSRGANSALLKLSNSYYVILYLEQPDTFFKIQGYDLKFSDFDMDNLREIFGEYDLSVSIQNEIDEDVFSDCIKVNLYIKSLQYRGI